ncbi:calcium-independent phospholipase A2-gamma-like [Panulirus ornatus]|uniref:calcium-independent phospholipase A2-gamma-like n=1 Tax=Panulirus ornatus TaxID=150431 RepID=UPI003A89D293
MASGGNSVTHWRLLTQLRDFITRATPPLAVLQRDLTEVIKKIPDTVQATTDANPQSAVNKCQNEKGNKEELNLKHVDMNGENLSEMQKALKTMNAYIPLYFSQVRLNFSKNEESKTVEKNIPKWRVKKDIVSKASIDARTRHLVKGLNNYLTETGRIQKLKDLCNHLRQYPQAKGVAVKRGGIQRLLRILKKSNNNTVEYEVREALSLLGYTSPVKAQGIRLLTIDGGGIRGLVALEVLRKIEEEAGYPVYKLFDYICGVSTGAILAVLMGVHRIPLDECETLYRELSTKIFTQTTFKGATSLFMRNSYYDSDSWTELLKEYMGEKSLIETARDPDSPKICLVATSANTNRIQAYLFRNYNLPYRVTSHYQGTSLPHLWEAARASAAAPGYFSEFRIGDLILLDGGLFVNNPTAIAVHEAKQLWPDVDLQCVLSVGTGRHEPIATTSEASISWATRIRTVLNSATDTEGVHTTMHDLLPGNVYYRFNPYLTDEIGLDEIGADRLALMMEDTRLYLRKNEMKIQEAVQALTITKNPLDRIKDWYQYQRQLWPSV